MCGNKHHCCSCTPSFFFFFGGGGSIETECCAWKEKECALMGFVSIANETSWLTGFDRRAFARRSQLPKPGGARWYHFTQINSPQTSHEWATQLYSWSTLSVLTWMSNRQGGALRAESVCEFSVDVLVAWSWLRRLHAWRRCNKFPWWSLNHSTSDTLQPSRAR